MHYPKDKVEALGEHLMLTSKNVYYEGPKFLDVEEVEENIFADLYEAGYFKCEICNTWMLRAEESPYATEWCRECFDEENLPLRSEDE